MAMVGRAAGWLGIKVTDDETAWCGTFVSACLATAGFKPPRGAVGVRARWWGGWGDPLSLTERPPLGAIAVYSRPGGGHVGFVVGMTPQGDLIILGGNQGNAVTEARFARNDPRLKLVALRWPAGVPRAAPVPWVSGPVAGAGTVT